MNNESKRSLFTITANKDGTATINVTEALGGIIKIEVGSLEELTCFVDDFKTMLETVNDTSIFKAPSGNNAVKTLYNEYGSMIPTIIPGIYITCWVDEVPEVNVLSAEGFNIMKQKMKQCRYVDFSTAEAV